MQQAMTLAARGRLRPARLAHSIHFAHCAPLLLAVLAMLGASAASAQTPPPSYGPVLHLPPATSATANGPAAQVQLQPQAQEEKAGRTPPPNAALPTPDPSARAAPAPSPARAAPAPRTARRAAPQRVEPVPVAGAYPSAPQASLSPLPATPQAPLPNPVQLNGCTGSVCRDTSGGAYQTGVGNAGVDGSGRLCTRSGNTLQCF